MTRKCNLNAHEDSIDHMFKTVELNKTSLWKVATLSRSYPLLSPVSSLILWSHWLEPLLIFCTFVKCATTHNQSPPKCAGSRELQHETWLLLRLGKLRFSSKARHGLLPPRKTFILYLIPKCNKFYNIKGSNVHAYSNMFACYQDFSIASQWRMVNRDFWGPGSQSSW